MQTFSVKVSFKNSRISTGRTSVNTLQRTLTTSISERLDSSTKVHSFYRKRENLRFTFTVELGSVVQKIGTSESSSSKRNVFNFDMVLRVFPGHPRSFPRTTLHKVPPQSAHTRSGH